ncbi:MAG: glycosyltransferase [Planctomycetes bacterium]|nr:glycosyltransferase [Planctomycetota bacterium]
MAGGIVARIQGQRRFDLLFTAFAAAAAQEACLRLVVIGRGTRAAEIARAPVRRLGIEERVLFAGYRAGEAYDALLAALDFGVFLVPGSDGSCRAARELAAASLPVVATTRPPLPEIVEHGATGFVLPEEPERFAAAFVELAREPAARARLGAAARERACRLFSLERQAQQVGEAYEVLARLGPRRRS